LDQSQVSCNNCHAVTTNDGKTVWVCEQCGTENLPAQADKSVDVAAAQAVVSDAAAAAGAVPAAPAAPAAPVVTPTDQPVQ